MEEGKILVSCYGFWLGVEDGKAGNGSPRSVYCIIGEKALGLTFSKGEVLDLLDPETVRSMYGPCSLEQMIGYIKEATSARGGDLGIDFETSIFAKIVEHPEQYTSDETGPAQVSSAAQEEIPKRWRVYFKRSDSWRQGYLLQLKLKDNGVGNQSSKMKPSVKQFYSSQKALRKMIGEYHLNSSGTGRRAEKKSAIIVGLRLFEEMLEKLGVPISDMEKELSQRDVVGDVGVTPVSDVRTQGRRAGRGSRKDSKKRKIGIVAFKKVASGPIPGRPMQSLSADQKKEKEALMKKMQSLESKIARALAALRENRSAAGPRKKLIDGLAVARQELKATRDQLTTLLYGEPASEALVAVQAPSSPENDGVGSVVAAVEERVEDDPDVPAEESVQGGVVIPFPHAMPPSDGASVVEESVAPEDFPLSVIGSESFRAFCAEMEAMREELESLLATLQAQFRASGIYESETFERFKELNGRKGDALQNLQVLTDKMAAMFPPCRVGRMSLQ